MIKCMQQKLWSSGRALGFDPRPMLDGSDVKAMPGLIPTHNSGSLQKNKKKQVAKWVTPKNFFFKERKIK